MENRVILNQIPESKEIPEMFNKVDPIDIKDFQQITFGAHEGRVCGIENFVAKNKQTKYSKIKIGTRKKFDYGDVVQEVDRVFPADYHNGSELVKLLEKFGCIENHKFYPERLLNKPVSFTVEELENVSEDARYKTKVTNIEPIDGLSEDIDFKYVRVFDGERIDYVPTFVDAKPQSESRQQVIGDSPASKIKFEEEDDEDFLKFD